MEIILLEKVNKLGDIGQTVKVKPGYARNFLFPNKIAIRATEENKQVFEKKKDQLQKINLEKKLPSRRTCPRVIWRGLLVHVLRGGVTVGAFLDSKMRVNFLILDGGV